MKKMVATIATGVIIAGAAVTNVSAEEYNVQKGDTLWAIAEAYNTTVDELVKINELDTTVIQPNQKLFINETYVVVRGDTLTAIGKQFDVSVKDLKKWNNLKSDLIVIGQELEIKGVNVPEQDKSATEIEKASKSTAAKEVNEQAKQKTSNASEAPEGKTISVTATAYTAKCDGCSGITSTGIDLNANPNAKVIAVDPNVIPLGSEVYVEGYGYATAADIGGAIKGHKIDIHVPTKKEAYNWGVKKVNVTIVK
ncbi:MULTISPECIES: LysM peptidoglycan-binding and 3D domain-containing protein [unclassified Virgibacillus]|uniref:3D domain-containing protein n=1 Tax=unclassified Virgibacillus TaxID=2620237 RepID=UPI0024DEF087|nr:LysM peptidoglycan-binding and 3D domain-containing protein [Virgibacillus sp. LDC-1]